MKRVITILHWLALFTFVGTVFFISENTDIFLGKAITDICPAGEQLCSDDVCRQNCLVREIMAYSNSYDVRNDQPSQINLYGNNENNSFTFYLSALPKNGRLLDNTHEIIQSELPYLLSSSSISYFPIQDYDGLDTFQFYSQSSNGISTPATIYLSIFTYNDSIPSYRQQLQPINESWWSFSSPLPQTYSTTKQDYLDYIIRVHEILQYEIQNRSLLNISDAPHDEYALLEAFMYNITAESSHLQLALQLINASYQGYLQELKPTPDPRVSFQHLEDALKASLMILQAGDTLTTEDRQLIKDYLLFLDLRYAADGIAEYGVHNRPMSGARSRAIIDSLYPDEPDNSTRVAYAETMWNEFAPYLDSATDSEHYNALYNSDIISWLDNTNKSYLYQDSRLKSYFERYKIQASPFGIQPHHGDGTGLNSEPGEWIAFYERMADIYEDGNYKWLAHRTFEWTYNWTPTRWEEMKGWGNLNYNLATDLIYAYIFADETIPEAMPVMQSSLTTRTGTQWGVTRPDNHTYGIVFINQTIPDKLTLRSENSIHSFYALLELSYFMDHDHCDMGSINFLSVNGSVLLSDTPYQIKNSIYHNAMQIIDGNEGACYRGPTPPFWNLSSQLNTLSTSPASSFAEIELKNYSNKAADVKRKLFLVEGEILWVRDSFVATGPLNSVTVGPTWHTGAIYGVQGENWVNTAFPTVPSSYIKDVPYMLMQWENVPYDLLLVFPNSSYSVESVRIDNTQVYVPEPLMNNARYMIWQNESGNFSVGERRWYHSILIPHTPSPDVAALANSVKLLVDEENISLLQIDRQTNSLLLGINTYNSISTFPFGETDAASFLIEVTNDSITKYWLSNATYLSFGNEIYLNSSSAKTVYLSCPLGCPPQSIINTPTENSGSGGGGGASSSDQNSPDPSLIDADENCEELWKCTNWSECKDGQRTRECQDVHVCNTQKNKPLTIQSCVFEMPSPQDSKFRYDFIFIVAVALMGVVTIALLKHFIHKN